MNQTFELLMTKHKPVSSVVQANPWQAIPIKNNKQAKNTTQVHLGKRKATILTNFINFPNLQTVWLNQNKLTTLQGLQKNFRIKHLFVQKNKLRQIDGIFQKLRYVQTLIISDNQLRDLDKIIKELKVLKNLKHLQMFQNPAAHEPNYKFRVITSLPTLQILDRHKITYQERLQAQTFMNNQKNKKKGPKRFLF